MNMLAGIRMMNSMIMFNCWSLQRGTSYR